MLDVAMKKMLFERIVDERKVSLVWGHTPADEAPYKSDMVYRVTHQVVA